MKILMAASECVPFVKVGGLADVVGTLPAHLKSDGNDVRVVIPKYRKIDERRFGLKRLSCRLLIPVGGRYEEVTVMEGRAAGNVRVYFIENARFFDRPEVYRTPDGDYPDNRERFIFFSRAVLETVKALGFQPDVIHCHDWQTGIIPAYLKTVYRIDGFFCRTSTAYTIHNIAYQGSFGADTVDVSGLSWNDYTWDRLEYYGGFNFMKTGLVYADVLSTVSPTYAREIQTEAFGRGMESILRARSADLFGILNGIDYGEWSPESDRFTAAKFSRRKTEGKSACRADLLRSCGLPQIPGAAVIGAVSRLDPQKGYDLVVEALPSLLDRNVQFVMLGTGDRSIQDALRDLAGRYPDRVSVNFEFNDPLAHKIYAGADLFLMPSRFEPCGLGQMIALSYGTVPVVNDTGGLSDTVTEFEPASGSGNGFVMKTASTGDLASAVDRALASYRDRSSWRKVTANAMSADFSWSGAVKQYKHLYEEARRKRLLLRLQ